MTTARSSDRRRSKTQESGSGGAFRTNKLLHVLEMVAVFVVGASAILTGIAVFGDGVAASIGSVWVANVLMLCLIHVGLRLRGQQWRHLGLPFGRPPLKSIGISLLQSIPVFVVAVIAFAIGAIVMANLVGMPEPANMTQYDDLRGNLPMTLLALGSVYFVSAFAEEIIYRGFLITRLTEWTGNGKPGICFAILLSSVTFGLIHSDWGITGMVQATCMGVALGTSYFLVKRNLWTIILAHAYMDTILVLQMYAMP